MRTLDPLVPKNLGSAAGCILMWILSRPLPKVAAQLSARC